MPQELRSIALDISAAVCHGSAALDKQLQVNVNVINVMRHVTQLLHSYKTASALTRTAANWLRCAACLLQVSVPCDDCGVTRDTAVATVPRSADAQLKSMRLLSERDRLQVCTRTMHSFTARL